MEEVNSSKHILYPGTLSIAKVIAPYDKKRDVIRAIEDLESVQPVMVDPRIGVDQIRVEERRIQVEAYRTKINTLLSSLDTDLIPKDQKIDVGRTDDEVLAYLKELMEGKGKQITDISSRKDAISSRISDLEGTIKLVERFATISVDQSILKDTKYTHTFLGTVFPPQIPRILWFIEEITDGKYYFLDSVTNEEEAVILVTVLQKDAETIEEKLKEVSAQEIEIPDDQDFEGLSISDCTAEIAELHSEQEKLEEELNYLSESIGAFIMAGKEAASIEIQRIEIELKMKRTETTCVLWAWIPPEMIPEFQTKIHSVTDGAASFNFRGGEFDKENSPSHVKNSKFMKPLRGLVTAYGTPGHNEIDPFPFVKILFPMLFAIMFADVMHGLILTLIGFWALNKRKKMAEPPSGLSAYLYNGAELLILMGIWSFFMGFAFNSFFGDETILWSVPILRAIFEPFWNIMFTVDDHNHISRNYLNFLIFSFAMGAVVIILGLGVKIYQLTRNRHSDADLHAALTLTAVYVFLILAALFMAVGAAPWVVNGAIILSILNIVATLWIEKRAHGVDGLMLGFDHVLSLMSNTFSFGRLLAMNTVHFVLATLPLLFISIWSPYQVINHSVDHWIEDSATRWVWLLGSLLGSLIVVPIETVFSTLQALRLNWVEFFGKFYTGRGKQFQPVSVLRIYSTE